MEEFKKELIALMKKHDVIIAVWNEYGHNEGARGESFEFLGQGWGLPIDGEYFNELLKE